MLQPHFFGESNSEPGWDLLQHGIPTIIGFARLCGAAISRLEFPNATIATLSPEAQAIAFVAKDLGVIELRGNRNAFEPADRFLAVSVPINDDRRLLFKSKSQPRQSLAFLEGFRQLCASGLVIHHLLFDFSLTTPGFALADQIDPKPLQPLIDFATTEAI
jgi:hypothetical protein